MHTKRNVFIAVFSFLILTIFVLYGTYYYILDKQKILLDSTYNSTNTNILKLTEKFLDNKINTTLAIALSLVKDYELHKLMATQEYDKFNYSDISQQIKDNTKFKNIWIQIIDKNGNSIYRSWSDKKGDNLFFRKDLKNFVEDKKVSTSISVGLYSMTIKARAPIIDEENNFLGALEIIGQFNSIANDLKENKIDSVIIADKKYNEIIQLPFSKIFIDDYYVANVNVNKELITYLQRNKIEKYLKINNYIIENNYLISKFDLYNNKNERLGYILNFVKLNDIDIRIVESFKIQTIMISAIVLIIMLFLFLIYLYTSYLRLLKIQENKKEAILNSQENIIVITLGNEIIDANQRLYDFFINTKDLESFKKTYKCICSTFIDMQDDIYIIEKYYNGKNWAEYILANPDKNFRVAIKNMQDKIRHFSIKCSIVKNEEFIIATFTDITQEIEQIQANKEKDRILFQQSKIAAITDTLKNIAHQWRQPLSVISTITSGMKLQKELNILDDNEFNLSCDGIINNTNKLSTTIDNFTNFFNTDNNSTKFSLIEALENTQKFMNSILEKNSIECQFIYDSDIILDSNKNDFSQAILNILDNSVHALITIENIEDRFIFIEFKNNILQIKDSGNGIDKNIISKILEPYFTTKHQAFGIGLGLYIVNEFFVQNLGYKIDIQNVTYDYKNKNYSGLNFIIDFN
ncbi:MAG: ATP-binding protein [Aliarcobacter sp.]|jgi:signal transduction histidine kinase|nr:ATP-binding protein [Aliarcobacter sp.]